MSRLGSSRGAAASFGVQQLRDKVDALLSSAGHQTSQQKTEYLTTYISKWSMGRQRMTHQQFIGALQSLHLPLAGAGEVFSALDKDGNGSIDIREFCDAVLVPGSLPPARSAMRAAGSAVLGSASNTVAGGLPGVGGPADTERYERTGTMMPAAPAERGYTPRHVPSMQKVGSGSQNGSRTGSRMASATRNPAMSGAAEQGVGGRDTMPMSRPPRARPPMSKTSMMEVDLSDMLVDRFRAIVLHRGGAHGIHTLARTFRIMDDDRNRRISLDELHYGLQDYGIHMEVKDLQLLLAAIDRDNTGSLSFDEFLVAIRGVISPRRQALINMAFDILDASGDGVVRVDDIAANFSARGDPDVLTGRHPEDQALERFLNQFDGVNRDGTVTRNEFMEYYKNVSASIDDDDYFELMIRNAWHISGGSGQYQNTANTRLLVTLVDGTQKVVSLEHDLGLDVRNAAAVKAQLKAQGITNVSGYSIGSAA